MSPALTLQKLVIYLKTGLRSWLSRHPLFRAVLLLVVVGSAALLIERWRGHSALSRWKQRMAAQGELLDISRIWPAPSAQGRAFSNELDQAVSRLPRGLEQYAGRISGMVLQEPGMARRGSQESSPRLAFLSNETNQVESGNWAELEQEIRLAQPAFQSLHRLLRNPPGDRGFVLDLREQLIIPHSVNVRKAAQALQAAAVCNLHTGDLEQAKDNLVALAAFTRVYARDPTIVNYMIRIAILGLCIETAWDALQAVGWTDAQLADLQRAFDYEDLLAQLPRTIEAERATWLYELDWFSSHSYLAWVARYQSLYESLGYKVPVSAQVYAARYWREWVSHPLWRFAWADQEKLHYLEHVQHELEISREAARTGSGTQLGRRLESLQTSYHPPAAGWRFYIAVPLIDQMSEKFGGSLLCHDYPYADFRRAWSVSMKNLTLCQLLRTAIGVKRYELRQGKPPATLEALVPEFLAKLPPDFMDGQPLRYTLRSNGSYCLYSIGSDARDDQGNPVPAADNQEPPSPWNGRDWVWPRTPLATVPN